MVKLLRHLRPFFALSIVMTCVLTIWPTQAHASANAATGLDGLTEKEAQDRLDSLRRSSANLEDLSRIVTQYERFVEQVKGTNVLEAARADLALWRSRLDRGAVRSNGQWIFPEDLESNRRKATDLALQARLQLFDGQPDQAAEMIEQAILLDPKCIAANYIRGVMVADTLPKEAVRCFEIVRESAPDHAPTLNNLAAIYIKLEKPQLATIAMNQALQAAPGVRVLIDNARELSVLLPKQVSESSSGQEMMRQLAEQEAQLAVKLAERGLVRVGATWIDQAVAKISEDDHAAAVKQTRPSRVRLNEIDARSAVLRQEIRDNLDLLRLIERDTRAASRSTFPDTYYALLARNNELRSTLRENGLQVEQLRTDLGAIESSKADKGFSGKLRIIGEDGIPVPIGFESSAATTHPSTAPVKPDSP